MRKDHPVHLSGLAIQIEQVQKPQKHKKRIKNTHPNARFTASLCAFLENLMVLIRTGASGHLGMPG